MIIPEIIQMTVLFTGLGTIWVLLTKRMKKDIELKADRKELFKEIEFLDLKITNVKESSNSKFDMILDQFKELRSDLKLKKDKDAK